jgi:hypothetical protein
MLAICRERVQFQSEEFYEAQGTLNGTPKGYHMLPESLGCILGANCQALRREQGIASYRGHSEQAITAFAAPDISG